ncbi:hypothetical protein C2S53_018615 [Perilla frutescens var. hirtella]|uniref:Uncharacterized protein n=1 Tax=Perilla frutescens var. hirtella TaxID=608512 RepID=A0AAD4J8X3_PERFH|nr:hypothetical protein C2S53_018615 [Perilla frutescens var. hirtella]
MLPLFFTVAFSAAPLILYVPPLRSLNLFVETVTFVLRDAVAYFLSVYPRLRVAISRFVSPHIAAAGR